MTEKPTACSTKKTCAQREAATPLTHFKGAIGQAVAAARAAKAQGRKIAGIFCEYTPRELFFAAGVLPVVMCGGQANTIAEAEKDLPANLCPLIKSSYGHARLGSNPFMQMADLLVAETTCDGKKKMYELLGRYFPMHVMTLPHRPDQPAALQLWLEEIRALKLRLEELAHTVIDDDALKQAIIQMNQERQLRRQIAYLAASHPPRLSGEEILSAKNSLSLLPGDLQACQELIDWAQTRPALYAHRPRLLLTGVPHPHGAEKVLHLLEHCGGVVVAQETCTGLKPIMDIVLTSGDPWENLARFYLSLPCSCMTPNPERLRLLDRLVADFAPDGIVELVWQACHTYNIEAESVQQRAKAQWGLPYLKLETDYSPGDMQQLTLRIEAFLEICQTQTK